MTIRKTFTTVEMRDLAHGQGSQFLMDDMRAALLYAADVMDAAEQAIAAQRGVAPAAPAGNGGWMAAMVKLSRALGHPLEIEVREGQSVDAALIEMAAERIAADGVKVCKAAGLKCTNPDYLCGTAGVAPIAPMLRERVVAIARRQGLWGPGVGSVEMTAEELFQFGEACATSVAPAVPAGPDSMASHTELNADAERLDFLDRTNARFRMGWKVGKAPAGNVSVQSVIYIAGRVIGIREAIDAARNAGVPDTKEGGNGDAQN